MALSDKSVTDILTTICPALVADEVALELYTELATEMTSSTWFGTLQNYAIALRAAHIFTIDAERSDGSAGLITGKSEDNVSIRYYNKVDKGRYTDLAMTHYGQRLIALSKARGPSASISNTTTRL